MTEAQDPASTGRSLGWSALGTIGTQFSQFVGLLILARVLSPADFGLAALATTVTAFAVIFVNSGIGAFVVHARSVDQTVLSTVFWINAALAVLVGALVVAIAPLLATAFSEPRLSALIAIAAIGFVLGIGATHLGILEREMRFKAIAVIDISAAILSITTTIVCANHGFGAFAIVVGALAGQMLQLVGYWSTTRWFPTASFDRSSNATLWRYAGHVMGFNAINYWSRNFDNLAIGWQGTAAQLGLYTRSYSLMLVPVNLIPTVVGRVLLATISRMQKNVSGATRLWSDHMVLSLMLGIPAAALLGAFPELTLSVLLGPEWEKASLFLFMLILGIPPQLVLRATGPLLQALGLTRAYLVLGIIGTVIMIAAIVIGAVFYGPYGVAVGVSLAFYAQLIVFVAYARARLNLVATDLVVAMLLLVAYGAVSAALGALCVGLLAFALPVVQLVVGILAVLGTYVSLMLTFGRRYLREAVRLVSSGTKD